MRGFFVNSKLQVSVSCSPEKLLKSTYQRTQVLLLKLHEQKLAQYDLLLTFYGLKANIVHKVNILF